MGEVTFTVSGPPVPKARARLGRGRHWFTPDRTRNYERAVRWSALAAIARTRWQRQARYVVEVSAYFPDARRRDADNVGKSVLDACNGVLWDDDSQVAALTVRREIDRANPRTEVRVQEAA